MTQSQNANNGPWYDYEEFASMAGFGPGMDILHQRKELKWTNTATDLHTGGVHGVRYKVEKPDDQNLTVMLQHWVQWPGNKVHADEQKKRQPYLLVLRAETRAGPDGRLQIRPLTLEWMGKPLAGLPDFGKYLHMLQETAGKIRDNILHNVTQKSYDPGAFPYMQQRLRQTRQKDEIPNLYEIAQRCDLRMPALEGMSGNGEFNFGKPARSDQAPVYPLQLLRPMLALEYDILTRENQPFSRTYSMPAPNGGFEGTTFTYMPNEDGFGVSCKIWSNGNIPRQETELYNIQFRAEGVDHSGAKLYRLTHLEMLDAKPDIRDHKGVSRAIRAMKYIHMAIQRNEAPMFSDILNEHDLKSLLRQPPAPETGPDNPRTQLQVFGANTDAVFSKKEMSIGSNGLAIIRDFKKNGEWVKLGLGVDWGVTFGNPKSEYYHSITHNYGRFLRHPAAPHIQPYFDNILNLETHEHEDHLRGIVRFAKFGYTMPPMVMNRHTQRVLKRMLGEEGVPKHKVSEIMAKCHVIDIRRFINLDPAQKDKLEMFEYGDTVIEQRVETIIAAEDGREKFFPVLTAYSKKHPEAKTTIRVGPAGHSALALMFDVEGVLYTGDYKIDQSVPRDMQTDLDWLRKCRDTSVVHVQETTNASKAIPFNTPVAELRKTREDYFYKERNHRVFCDVIGSNAIDIVEGICRAAGNVRKRVEEENAGREGPKETLPFEYLVFAGTAVRNKYGDLNETHELKTMMKRDYGITVLHADTKTAQELFAGEKSGSFLTVMTGTQDEPLSMTHRVSRDLHDKIRLGPGDAVFRMQSPIPGDNRHQIRVDQNNRYRHDLGCTVYDAWELWAKDIYMSTSSHASQDDYRTVHRETGDLLKMLHHGGPEQLNAAVKLFRDMGARVMIPDKQALYEINKKDKTVRIIGETPEERVGFREIRDDEREFFKKHRQQPTQVRVKDRWSGPVAEKMYAFEASARHRDEIRINAGRTARGANVTEAFNESANGVADFPPIGLMHPDMQRPYYEKHKAIKLFIGMDTETTGANPAVDVHTHAGFVATTPDGEFVAEKKLKHAIPRYMMASPGALGVTHNTNPQDLHRGLKLRQYVHELYKTYRNWTAELTGDPAARALFHGYRNAVFDDPITMRMMGMALASKDMKPMATQGNLRLDVYNLYTAMIALMPDKVGVKRDEAGNCIRTLKSACDQNGIKYVPEEAHDEIYDSYRTSDLLFKLKALSPEIFEQMVMNCDFSSSRSSPMIDHILGRGQHINDQAPVFGFVDMRDRTCAPRIGGLVTIDKKATDAIVVDLAQADIQNLEQLSDQKLLELMNDPKGPFAVVKLNSSPCLFPPQLIWRDAKVRARAVGRIPKSTILQRANGLRQASKDNHDIGNSFAQRVHKLYEKSSLCRNTAYHGNAAAQGPANDNRPTKTFKLPNERIFSLFHLIKAVNQISNRHYKRAGEILRELELSESQFSKEFNADKFWRRAVKDIRDLSRESGGGDRYIEDLRFLIEWQADDANPRILPVADRLKMNALKSAMLHGPDNAETMTVARFRKEIDKIESDPEQFARIVGDGPEAKEKWESMKALYTAYADSVERRRAYVMTSEKRERVREHRKSQPDTKYN